MNETAVRLLHQRAASVRYVLGGEVNKFLRAVSSLEALSAQIGGPIAVVGGLAAIHHGAAVTTLDVDIVVSASHVDAFLQAAAREGFHLRRESQAGWHSLVFPDPEGDVEIQLIPEGKNSPRDPIYAPPNPSPSDLGVRQGLDYASFPGWVTMKLVAARDKDRYHLTEALKHATEQQIAEVVQRLRPLHSSYLSEFQRLLQLATAENQENW